MEAHFGCKLLCALVLFLSVCAGKGLGAIDNYERKTLLKHAHTPRPAIYGPAERAILSSSDPPQELYFPQQLDHFNYFEDRTWMQRYFLTGILCMYVHPRSPLEHHR